MGNLNILFWTVVVVVVGALLMAVAGQLLFPRPISESEWDLDPAPSPTPERRYREAQE